MHNLEKNTVSEQETPYQKIIAKCCQDDAFKQALLADPLAVLRQEGVEIPPGVNVNVIEDTETQLNLVIPLMASELNDADLDDVAGGCGFSAEELNTNSTSHSPRFL